MFLTIRFLKADLGSIFQGKANPFVGVLGGNQEKRIALIRVLMQIIVSLIILCFGIIVIIDASNSDKTKELAAGFLGSVVGYWIR